MTNPITADEASKLALRTKSDNLDKFFAWVKDQAESGEFSGVLSIGMLSEGEVNYIKSLNYRVRVEENIIRISWS